jgi:hypothetical protein
VLAGGCGALDPRYCLLNNRGESLLSRLHKESTGISSHESQLGAGEFDPSLCRVYQGGAGMTEADWLVARLAFSAGFDSPTRGSSKSTPFPPCCVQSFSACISGKNLSYSIHAQQVMVLVQAPDHERAASPTNIHWALLSGRESECIFLALTGGLAAPLMIPPCIIEAPPAARPKFHVGDREDSRYSPVEIPDAVDILRCQKSMPAQ